jgi:hypothetical protein
MKSTREHAEEAMKLSEAALANEKLAKFYAEEIIERDYGDAPEDERLMHQFMRASAPARFASLAREVIALTEALELAAQRLEVAATHVDRAETEFGFRVWSQEARAAIGKATP